MGGTKEVRVFLSSRFNENNFLALRDLVKKELEDKYNTLNLKVILLENDNDPRSALEASKQESEDSDIFIHILGETYGGIAKEESKSYTHLEYEKAKEKNIQILAYPIGDIYIGDIQYSDNKNFRQWQEDVLFGKHGQIVNKKYPTNYDPKEVSKQIVSDVGKVFNISFHKDKKGIDSTKMILGNKPLNPLFFIGREETVKKIYDTFFNKKENIIMLVGNGGIGKTTVASYYYHNFIDKYSTLIWRFADTHSDDDKGRGLENSIISLAEYLDIRFEGDFQNSREKQIDLILNEIENLSKPILFVIDNLDDYRDLITNYAKLQKTKMIHFLLTSRVTNFEEFKKIDINRLPPTKAKELFIKYYKKFDKKEEELLEKILKAIGYNTLAIEILAKNTQKSSRIKRYDLQSLLKDLQENGILNLSKRKEITTTYHDLNHATVEEIIEAMYNIANLDEKELNILTILSVLPEIGLSFEDILSFVNFDEDELEELIETLANRGWLELNDEEIKINAITAEIIRAKQKDKLLSSLKPLITKCKDILVYDLNTGAVKEYDSALKYMIYASNLVKYIKEKDHDISLVLDGVGNFYQTYGNLKEALKYYEKCKDLFEELHNSDKSNVSFKNGLAISYGKLGEIYTSLGDLKEALKYYEKFKNLTKELHNSDKSNVRFKNGLAISYSKLYEYYFKQKDCENAKYYSNLCFNILKELHFDFPEYKEFEDNYKEVTEFIENLNNEC